jgi:LacI family transcriptional regulator
MPALQRRKRTPRFIEIAKEAGVSPATVDRVLNERDSVSERTRERVITAAQRLGVPRILPTTAHALIHFDILLPTSTTPFFRRLNRALQSSIEMLDRRVVVHRTSIAEDKDDALARAILHPPYRRQGLIIAAPNTERVREALRTVIAGGEPVVAIVTNVSSVEGLAYVGIDHYRAGRTAGLILGRFARGPGRVLILSGRADYCGHMERVSGCRDALARSFADLHCDASYFETRDDEDRCYRAVADALRSGEPLAGIYNSGAGSAGIAAALRRFDRAGQVSWVTHEISDDHRQYLEQGILDFAIDQDPDWQAITAIQHLLHASRFVERTPSIGMHGEFRLYFSENLRDLPYLS